MKPERDNADHQHNQHRFDQHADKFTHRTRNGLGLVLHLHQGHARRQGFFDARGRSLERFAELNDVATFGHRHAEADDFFALMAHFDRGWVDIATGHIGNVTQLELLARAAANRHRFEFGFGVKLTTDANLENIHRRLQSACVFHRVLLAELRQNCAEV